MLVLLGVAGFVGGSLLLAERRWGVEKRSIVRRGFFADLVYGPVNVAMRLVVNGTVAVAVASWSRSWLPEGWGGALAGEALWLQALVLVVVLDFVFYLTHRLKHRWSWWWRLHETHHSSVDLDFLSSVRFHPLEKALDRCLFLVPITLIGPSPEAALVWSCIDTFFGLLVHANLPLRLGWLRYVFVGPEMHRWHHTRDARMQQRNFGNNFSVFDWLFGTAWTTRAEAKDFGIDEPDYPQENVWKQFLFAFRPLR